MRKPYGITEKAISLPVRERVFYIALVMVGFFLILSASRDIIAEGREYIVANSEYEQLRERYPVISTYIYQEQPAMPADSPPYNRQNLISDSKFQTPVFQPYSRQNVIPDSKFLIPNYGFPSPNTPHYDQRNAIPDSEFQIPNSPPLDQQNEIPNSEFRISNSPQGPLDELAGINPDFVGWISIDGVIEYPIVRGRDNNRYLRVTFAGQRNGSGAIFMDYRNTMGFLDTVCIIYGHNMKNGTMFAPLNRYADRAFLEEHPDITVVTSDGEILKYRIFAAKRVCVWDAIYDLKHSSSAAAAKALGDAPDGAGNYLLLSTCTPSVEKDERMLVYAALTD